MAPLLDGGAALAQLRGFSGFGRLIGHLRRGVYFDGGKKPGRQVAGPSEESSEEDSRVASERS